MFSKNIESNLAYFFLKNGQDYFKYIKNRVIKFLSFDISGTYFKT